MVPRKDEVAPWERLEQNPYRPRKIHVLYWYKLLKNKSEKWRGDTFGKRAKKSAVLETATEEGKMVVSLKVTHTHTPLSPPSFSIFINSDGIFFFQPAVPITPPPRHLDRAWDHVCTNRSRGMIKKIKLRGCRMFRSVFALRVEVKSTRNWWISHPQKRKGKKKSRKGPNTIFETFVRQTKARLVSAR